MTIIVLIIIIIIIPRHCHTSHKGVRMQSILRSYDWLIIRDKREMLGICVVINDLWRQIASGAAFRERLAVTRAGQKAAG